jgi:hypothetical protein
MNLSAPTNKLHDFVSVTGFEWSGKPVGARQDFEIAFDSDASRFEAEFAEQINHSGAGLGGTLLSVYSNGDGYLHRSIFPLHGPGVTSPGPRGAWRATRNANELWLFRWMLR